MRGGEHSFIPLQDYFFPRPAQQPTPAPRFRTRLIGDGEEKRGRHVVHKGTSREPFDYSGTLLDSRVQLVWMLSLERLRPTDRPTDRLARIDLYELPRPTNKPGGIPIVVAKILFAIASSGSSFSGT